MPDSPTATKSKSSVSPTVLAVPSRNWKSRRLPVGLIAGTIAALLLAACSSSASNTNSSSSSSSLPKTIKLVNIDGLTGAGAAYATYIKQGMELAVDDINSSHYLPHSSLSMTFEDSTGSPSTAASLANQAVGKYTVVFGPNDSGSAVAVAPILARNNVPTVFTQAGSPGVLIAKNIVRLTPLQTSYVPKTLQYLASTKAKSLAVIYDSDYPTLMDEANDMKNLASRYNYKYVGSAAVLSTTSDISSAVSKLLSFHPAAIGVLLVGAQNSSLGSLLSQANFHGPVISAEGALAGLLGSKNSEANGWTWTADWNPPGTNQKSKIFTSQFEAKFHATPTLWSAEAYDAVYYAAAALKAANSTVAAKVDAALATVGANGFNGILGSDLVVRNGQEYSNGFLVRWENGGGTIVG